MCRFIETIHVINGFCPYLSFHQKRIDATLNKWSNPEKYKIRLDELIPVIDYIPDLSYKWRLIYRDHVFAQSIGLYEKKQVQSLRVVDAKNILYDYKYADRHALEELFALRGICDDILIVKDGVVSDSFYANLVFEKDGKFYTPKHPLLPGVKRSFYLQQAKIEERIILIDEIPFYSHVHLINAMLNIGDVVVECDKIAF